MEYGPAISVPSDTPPEGLDQSSLKNREVQWRETEYHRWNTSTVAENWSKASWEVVSEIRLPADHPYYHPSEVNYSKPVYLHNETLASLDYDTVAIVKSVMRDGSALVRIPSKSEGYFVFDKNGQCQGHERFSHDPRMGISLRLSNTKPKRYVWVCLKTGLIHKHNPGGSNLVKVDVNLLEQFLEENGE